jgi:hypothetical protein
MSVKVDTGSVPGRVPDAPATAPTSVARQKRPSDVAPTPSPDLRSGGPLPSLSPKAQTALQLADELSKQQLRLVDAQLYLTHALATAPLTTTHAAAEDGAADALRSLASGGAPDVQALVAQVAATGGDTALAVLPAAVAAHRNAIADDLTAEARPIFAERAERFALEVDSVLLEHFATAPREPDRKRAMASMLAASTTLDGARLPETWMFDSLYNYTNEPGLPAALANLERSGGAAVGVSGALFDVAAARRADLVVLTDVSPPLKDWFLLVAAALLTADEKQLPPDEHQKTVLSLLHPERIYVWDDPEATSRSDAEWRRSLDSMKQALLDLGIDAETATRIRLMHEDASRSRPPKGSWVTDPDAVMHLTRLAREGKIVATFTDVADPALAPRLAALFRAHGTRMSALHLSNALDYTPAARQTLESAAKLPHRDDTLVVTSVDAYSWASILGSFYAPKVQPLSIFVGDDGLAAQLEQIIFASHHSSPWTKVVHSLTGRAPEGLPPKNFAEYTERVVALAAREFEKPGRAEELMKQALGDDLALAARVATPTEIRAALPPSPTTFAELQAVHGRFEPAFWTPERRTRLVASYAAESGVDPKLVLRDLSFPLMRTPIKQVADDARRTTASLRFTAAVAERAKQRGPP